MKNHFTLRSLLATLLFCILTSPVFSHILSPQSEALLYDHLVEVNKEWLRLDADIPGLCDPAFFTNDQQRIQKHLQLVEQILRQKQVENLSAIQKENRMAQLAVLRSYWQTGRFPVNTQHAHRQPYFVDDFGTTCAVGYLVQQDGSEALVERIARENNFAYLREMEYPELGIWAAENGFTLDELAWIQPGYDPWWLPRWHGPGDGGGADGLVKKMLADEGNDRLYIAGEFSEIDGVAASSIVAWDGADWHTLGAGLQGTINDLILGDNGDLYVAGHFDLQGEPTNVAYWNGMQWRALQTGDMEGAIEALLFFNDRLYIGGDFQKVNGEEMAYLAYYNNDGTWTNHGMDGGQVIPNAFTVNEKVRCFEIFEGALLVGGYFTQTAPGLVDPAHQLEANYLAFWNGNNWTHSLMGEHLPVNVIKEHDGSLYVGGEFSGTLLSAVYTDSEWYYTVPVFEGADAYLASGDSLIHDFIAYDGDFYMVGGFQYSPANGISGQNIVTTWNQGGASGVDYFDNAIMDAEVFGDKLFIAGDFTRHNGLCYFVNGGGVAVNDLDNPPGLKVTQSQEEILVAYDNLDQAAHFRLFNLQGELLSETPLPRGQGEIQVSTSYLASGMYVYQLANEVYKEAGKVMVFGF